MYRLVTLGSLGVEGNGFARPKPLLLLTYLADEGAKDRRHLASLFWPYAPDPLNRLSVTLSRLSRTLPGSFEATPTMVRTQVATDAHELREALQRGDLETARRLYGGAFLLGVRVRGAGTELHEWIDACREELALGLQRALLGAASRRSSTGDDEGAARLVREALRVSDTSLLETHELGFAHAALDKVRDPLAARVARELAALGVEVGSRSPPAPTVVVPVGRHKGDATQPSRGWSPVLGRGEERSRLRELIAARGRRLVTVTGPGGVGKSTLARLVVDDLGAVGAFAGGIAFVECDRVTSAEDALRRSHQLLGLDMPPDDPLIERLVERLRARDPTLLVLDDFDHLVSEAGWVSRVLAGATTVSVLVTSTQPLGLREEAVFPLAGLPLDVDGTGPARHLFLEHARRADAGFDLTPSDAPDLVAMHELVGGIPLAIELAAAWAGVMPVSEIVRTVAVDVRHLRNPLRDPPARHQSIAAVFERAWGSLDAREREHLVRLAVFRGPFSPDAASGVGVPVESLAVLCRKSLLTRRAPAGFACLPLLRSWLGTKTGALESVAENAGDRHATYFLNRARDAADGLDGRHGRRWLARLDAERDDVLAALEWRWDRGEVAEVAALLSATSRYWLRSGNAELALRWYERVAALAADDELALDVAACLDEYAFTLMIVGDTTSPEGLLERALSLTLEHEGSRPHVRALDLLGMLAACRLDFGPAEALLQDAFALARRHNLDGAAASALHHIGDVNLYGGRPEQAGPLYEESLDIERTEGNLQVTAGVLGGLGLVAAHEGELALAERRLRESLRILAELGIGFRLAAALERYAALFTAARRPLVAGRLWGAAEALRHRLGTPQAPFAELAKARWLCEAVELAGPESMASALEEGRSTGPDAARDLAFGEGTALAAARFRGARAQPGAHPRAGAAEHAPS